MPKCVICAKEVSSGSFNMKDKYELAGNSFICKECAEKMGIRNFFSAGIGSNAASRYIEKVYFVAKVNQHPTNDVEAMVVAMNNSDLSKGSGRSVADELTKLKALLDQGVLTQEEFDAQKAKLLKR